MKRVKIALDREEIGRSGHNYLTIFLSNEKVKKIPIS